MESKLCNVYRGFQVIKLDKMSMGNEMVSPDEIRSQHSVCVSTRS